MNIVKISDFNVVSYLIVRHYRILATSRDGRRILFHFQDTDELRDEVNNFRYGSGDLVSAREFSTAQSRLKDIIFDNPC